VKDFYNYEDKYQNNEAQVRIPAAISDPQKEIIKKLAEKTYRICECRGFARIDFFLVDDEIYINEINTLPGFTDISMFPMLMTHTGMSYTELIDRIIQLGWGHDDGREQLAIDVYGKSPRVFRDTLIPKQILQLFLLSPCKELS